MVAFSCAASLGQQRRTAPVDDRWSRWFPGMKEPLVSGHVAAFYGGRESFELFVVDIRPVSERCAARFAHRYHAAQAVVAQWSWMRLLASRPMPGLLTYAIQVGLLTAVPDIVSGPSFTFLSQAMFPNSIATRSGHARRIHRVFRRLSGRRSVSSGAASQPSGITTWCRTIRCKLAVLNQVGHPHVTPAAFRNACAV